MNLHFQRCGVVCLLAFTGLIVSATTAQAQSCSTVTNTTTCTAANGLVNVSGNTAGRAIASTYPLQLTVPALSGTIQNIRVSLNGLKSTSTFSGGDFMVMLVSPSGEKLEILSQYCNDSADISGINLILDDSSSGTAKVNGPSFGACSGVVSGTFHTTAGHIFNTNDTFPTPAPTLDAAHTAQPAGTGTLLNTFTASPTGTWSLYVAMQTGGFNTGSLGAAGSPAWSLAITVNASNQSTSTTLSRSAGTTPALNTDSLHFHAAVSPTPTGGTVTFLSDNVNISGCVGLALGTDCVTTLPEGAHNITAAYGGTTGFGASTSPALFQAINHTTTTSNITTTSGTYCNTGGITVPGPNASNSTVGNPASVYPSEVFVGTNGTASLGGVINTVTVTLNTVSTNFMSAQGLMLVSPSGQAVDILSQAGPGSVPASFTSMTISDTGALGHLASGATVTSGGSYLPTSNLATDPTVYCKTTDTANNVCGGVLVAEGAPTSFTFSAPRGSGNLGLFGGASPNGTWKLFVIEDANSVNTIGSWCLNFSDSNGDATATTLTTSQNPSATGSNVTFTATVTDTSVPATQINTGTVAFTADGNTISGCSAITPTVKPGGGGTAVCNTTALLEGAHNIVATYSGTATLGTSHNTTTLTQRVDNASTLSINGSTYTYCNPGTIQAPAGEPTNALRGIAAPWGSNVFATNLPGTLNTATVSMSNFVFTRPDWLQSLLVGPTGASIDFLSRLNTISPIGNAGAGTGGIAFTVSDTGATLTNSAPTNGSTVQPYSGSTADTFDTAPIGPGLNGPASGFVFAAPASNRTFTATNSVFGGGTGSTFNGNGTWSLYLESLNNGGFGGLTGWCVNLTENLPDISLTTPMTHSPASFKRGQSGSFTINAHNAGPGPSGNPTLTITQTLPTGLTFTSGTGTGWSCSAAAQLVTCTNATPIPSGGDSAVTINFTVGNTTADTISVTATSNTSAFLNGTGGDGTPLNNTSASGNITVFGTQLTINKTHTDPFTQGQTGASYSITVKNTGANGSSTGPGVTTGTVQVTDALPTAITLTGVSGTGWTCQLPAFGVNCTLDAALAVGATTNAITVTGNVLNTVLGPVTNTAVLTATTDQIGTGNSHDDPTNITQVPTQIAANSGTTPQSATVNTAFANALSVTVKDAGNNPVAGVPVTFTAPGSGSTGKFSNNTATITVNTNASGVASAPFTAGTVAGGPYTVTAAAASLTAVNFSLTNNPGAASTMTANAGTTPQSATVTQAFANALAVTVKDSFGNVVPGVNVTFTAPGSGASGTFSNSTATTIVATNASGIASAPFTANTTAGAYTATAAASGVTTVNFSLTNLTGAASQMTANAGTTPQSASISTAFANALAVTVKDANNNPVSGVSVTFTAPGSGASGTFSNSTATITAVTAASGIASASFTANGTAGGPYTVTAAASGLTTVNFSLTNTAGAASTMTANSGTTPQSATINTAFANALAVTIKDAGNNPVSGVNVTFTAPGSGASGKFSNNTATITVATNASGIASASFTANGTAGGPYTVTAAASGLTSVNFSLTNTAGTASTMTVNAGTTPQSATISTAFANALAVTIKDAGNNPVSGVNVTFTAPGTGASGTFSNATATITVATNASGVASAPFTANGTAGGPYTVSAAASGLTTVNFSLTNTTGAAASMTANAGTTPQSTSVGTAFANALAVTVKDAGNNPVSGVSVTFTAPASGASGTFSNSTNTITVATNVSGVASAAFTANGTAGGPYAVTAAASGLTSVSFSLTNLSVALPTMTANAGTTPQTALVNTAFANALAVTVRDPANNPMPGVSVTFTAPASGASGTFSNATAAITVVTGASGVASAPFTANGTVGGPYIVTASSAGLTSVNFSLTNTDAPTVVSYSVLFGTQSYNVIGTPRIRLPWQITGIRVTFSRPIASGDVNSLTGVTTTGFSGLGTNTLTWTITPVAVGSFTTQLSGSGPDALQDANGNGLAGGAGFAQAFKVLWGDFNDDGIVNATDFGLVNTARTQPYNLFADLNGDGVVDANDVNIARSRIGTTQP